MACYFMPACCGPSANARSWPASCATCAVAAASLPPAYAALGIVELLAVIEPVDPDHGRDRGLLLGRMGRFSEAIACLAQYLEERPDGHDAGEVRQVVSIFAGRRN